MDDDKRELTDIQVAELVRPPKRLDSQKGVFTSVFIPTCVSVKPSSSNTASFLSTFGVDEG
jgi:hypothetical protein